MVDSLRGTLRVRAWPKSRGSNRHSTNVHWTKWLKAVTYLYRYQPGILQWQMQADTKGTVWLPRDVFISATRGRAWLMQDDQGRTYYPMAFREEVSESLDAITQFEGHLLIRGATLWEPLIATIENSVLFASGPTAMPEWSDVPRLPLLTIAICRGQIASLTYPINSTSYINKFQTRFSMDRDIFDYTHFLVRCSGRSNQAGQTVTMQVVHPDSPTHPIHTGGDDLVVTNTSTLHDSGWLTADDKGGGGLKLYQIAFKGSNATVDLEVDELEVLFK